ncbi:HNH endonuclease [Nocardioides panacisoli]|uniref:HNH endonuclease signature motif containing protein n=1 Tax=Nocardioides panacisoli TaxID=627624 RepID=A0ABP7J4G4_9ACTN
MAFRDARTAQQLAELCASLQGGGLPVDPAALIDLIGLLETVKSAACAVQAEASVAYDAARRSAESARGVPARRQGRGVAAEIALARKESPHRGQVLLGFAKVACAEMPHLVARLKDGTLNEWRAMLVLRETACLSAEQRSFVDEEMCADPTALAGLGTRRLVAKVKRLAYELDPKAVVDRARNAAKDRHVTCRPAPDTMTYLTALLPVGQGVSVHAALKRDANTLVAAGDPRSRGQIMADLLVSRVTGVPMSTGEAPPAVPVGINLTMSATTLLGGHAPGLVEDEVVPAEIARLLAAHSLSGDLDTWIRQLYADHRGRLVAMTSKQRTFPAGLSDFLALRGQGICATPYCGAPVRHSDHVVPVEDGGATSAANGQGLCEDCNHVKQAPGWRQRPTDDGIETITPTGHRYLSHAPPPVGWREPRYVRVAPGRYQLTA